MIFLDDLDLLNPFKSYATLLSFLKKAIFKLKFPSMHARKNLFITELQFGADLKRTLPAIQFLKRIRKDFCLGIFVFTFFNGNWVER